MDLASAEGWARRLRGAAWLAGLRSLAAAVSGASPADHRLFVVGDAAEEPPWHLTAHLQLLHQAGRLPGGVPVLASPDDVVSAGAGDSVLTVAEQPTGAELLDRIDHVRRRGAAVFGLSGASDGELAGLSREFVTITPQERTIAGGLVVVSFETATHLLPVTATQRPRRQRSWGWPGRRRPGVTGSDSPEPQQGDEPAAEPTTESGAGLRA